MTYLELGNSLEATARLLFVHPNTVRYRLRRVSELTGVVPGDGRGGFSLWVAAVVRAGCARQATPEFVGFSYMISGAETSWSSPWI